jgi:dihydroorotase
MCHNPAKIFKIEKRGFIKEGCRFGYCKCRFAGKKKKNILAKCGVPHLGGFTFKSKLPILLSTDN